MKKKVVIYYLIIRSAVRLGAAAFLALDGVVALPYAVYLPTIAMAAGELGVTVWYFAKYITRQKLAFVLGLDTLLTLWNIVVLSVIPVSVSAAETMVCGTFLDVLLNLVLLVLVLKMCIRDRGLIVRDAPREQSRGNFAGLRKLLGNFGVLFP